MKKLKTLISVMLCAMLVLSLVVPSMATPNGTYTNDATITINNAFPNEDYSIYEILYIENFDAANNKYSYKATSTASTTDKDWADFVKSAGIKDVYLTVDADGYVTWKGEETTARKEAFANLAKTYAVTNSIAVTNTTKSGTGENVTVTFNNLEYGYYLITSTGGTLVFLDTTAKDNASTITEKHTKPSVVKVVYENTSDSYQGNSTQKIGDTVKFKTTVTAQKGALNYVLKDEMTSGLSLNVDSIKVYVGETISDPNLLDDANYTLTPDLTSDDKFEISFDNTYMANISATQKFTVVYEATLNKFAVIKGEADKGNINKTKLTYGTTGDTGWVATETWALKFDVIKTDSTNTVIGTAKFKLYSDAECLNEIKVVSDGTGVYRVAEADEANNAVEIEALKATIKGLDANTKYYLKETAAPVGYNKVTDAIEVSIGADNNCATGTLSLGSQYNPANGGVQVINKTGTELPSTGGTGTKILFTVGGIMMVVAFVLFTSKRRMAAED